MHDSETRKEKIARLCNSFERSWQDGQAIRVEDFVSDSGIDRSPDVLAELVPIEIHWRCQLGESPSIKDFAARFPELVDRLPSWFPQLDERGKRTDPVAQTTATATIAMEPTGTIPPWVEDRSEWIGRYRVLERLGAGAMGEVFKAQHGTLNRAVVLKSVARRFHSHAEILHRLREEAKRVAELSHEGVVQVYDCFDHCGQPWIAMEYVDGESVARRLDRTMTPFAPKAAAEIIRQAALALHHAHQRQVIHRDLKPSNIMLDSQNRPKIVDFGLAQRVVDPQQPTKGELAGTVLYMAPEQADPEQSEFSAVTDVYGLGATLYDMLTVAPPVVLRETDDPEVRQNFRRRLAALHRQIIRSPVLAPRLRNPEIPQDLESICLKCLEKSPELRYQTAQELAADLDRFSRSLPTLARPISYPRRFARWCRREPLLSSLVMVIAMLLCAVTTVFAASSAMLQAKNLDLDQSNRALLDIAEGDPDLDVVLTRDPAELNRLRRIYESVHQSLSEQGSSTALATLASLQLRIGKLGADAWLEESQQALDESIELYQKLCAQEPESPRFQVLLSDAWTALGRLQLNRRESVKSAHSDGAVSSFRRALELRDRLAQRSPADDDAARKQAGARFNLGLALLQLGATAKEKNEGRDHLHAAYDRQQALLAEHDQSRQPNPKLARDLAMSLYQRALGESDPQRQRQFFEESLLQYQNAAELFLHQEKLVDVRLLQQLLTCREGYALSVSDDQDLDRASRDALQSFVDTSDLLPIEVQLALLRMLRRTADRQIDELRQLRATRNAAKHPPDAPQMPDEFHPDKRAEVVRMFYQDVENKLRGVRQRGADSGEIHLELAITLIRRADAVQHYPLPTEKVDEGNELRPEVDEQLFRAYREAKQLLQLAAETWKPDDVKKWLEIVDERLQQFSAEPAVPVKTGA